MTKHELNIIKLADFIAEKEATGRYLTSRDRLIDLNSLVTAHAIVTGIKPIYYTQDKPKPAKDYVG